MQQALLVLLLGATLGALDSVAADKRPFFRQPFAFQRQTDGAPASPPETDDLSPPPSDGAASPPSTESGNPGGSVTGPYPPSGQPESGPYPPSGWKPEGQRLELPARQQKPAQHYGPPPKQPQQQYGPPPKKPQQQYGPPPKQPQQQYGPPPKQPQQQYGPPPKQPQQQYGPPPKQPQQQYGPPPKQPEHQYGQPPKQPDEQPETPAAAEATTESPEQVQAVNSRLKQQVRQQRVLLQRLRQQVRDQQVQLQQLQALPAVTRQQPIADNGEQNALTQQGLYEVTLPDGRLQRVRYATTPSSASIFKQSLPQPQPALQDPQEHEVQIKDPPTFVARLQFMDVPPINAPVFSYSGAGPLVQVA